MIEAAWIGSAEDYRAAFDAATGLVAEDDYAAKYTIEAMGRRRRAFNACSLHGRRSGSTPTNPSK